MAVEDEDENHNKPTKNLIIINEEDTKTNKNDNETDEKIDSNNKETENKDINIIIADNSIDENNSTQIFDDSQENFNNTTNEENNDEALSSDNPTGNSEYSNTNEERFRVDRKKLEHLLQDEQQGNVNGSFFHQIEQATNTTISWPAKLKIGAKSRKDPYIKVAGLLEDRQKAKHMVLSVMDTKSTRLTLKMDVSFADHSHIIGKGGNTIKKVMKDTQCHIHFPDSNRTSSEKSNQVSIAGPPFCVESARRQIRELLPIVLKFEIPQAVTVPDSSSPVISNISHKLNVNVTFQQQLRSYNYIGCVKGLHSDPFSVRDAVLKVLEHLTGTLPVTVPVTTHIEIDPKHHVYVVGHNGANIRKIQQATGASIHFPDPSDPNVRKSTVTITGTIESAVTAKVYLMQYLPLILMFDIRDGENDHLLEQSVLNHLTSTYDVQISVKSKPRQCCKSVIVKGHEKNALNIYKGRLHLIGEDPSNMPHLFAPLATLVISPNPATNPLPLYNMISQQQQQQQQHQQQFLQQQQQSQQPQQHPVLGTVTVDTSQSANTLVSPPVQSSSPQDGSQSTGNRYISVSPVGQRIVGIEMKMKRLSLDASMGYGGKKNEQVENKDKDGLSSSKSAESLLEALVHTQENYNTVTNKEMESLALSGSWNRPAVNSRKTSIGTESTLARPLPSQEHLDESANMSHNSGILNNVGLQRNFNVNDYEARKKMAKNAMHSQVLGTVRTPTDAWSGLGFSNSMPEAVIKELWNNRERKKNHPHLNVVASNAMTSPTTSLDSSVSSNGSSASAHSHGMGHQSPPSNKTIRRPPPGLGDSRTSVDNLLMMNNSGNDYTSVLSPSAYSSIKGIAELFALLSLEQYTSAFEKEEVDLQTFMSLNDEELRELGVATFGARKKMANAMKELQLLHNQQPWGIHNNNAMPQTTSIPSANGFYQQRPLHAFDVAAHSLRW